MVFMTNMILCRVYRNKARRDNCIVPPNRCSLTPFLLLISIVQPCYHKCSTIILISSWKACVCALLSPTSAQVYRRLQLEADLRRQHRHILCLPRLLRLRDVLLPAQHRAECAPVRVRALGRILDSFGNVMYLQFAGRDYVRACFDAPALKQTESVYVGRSESPTSITQGICCVLPVHPGNTSRLIDWTHRSHQICSACRLATITISVNKRSRQAATCSFSRFECVCMPSMRCMYFHLNIITNAWGLVNISSANNLCPPY